jgi:chaperonin cofactor prefoldin
MSEVAAMLEKHVEERVGDVLHRQHQFERCDELMKKMEELGKRIEEVCSVEELVKAAVALREVEAEVGKVVES